MNTPNDPICANVTGGVRCDHPVSEHDSGGCCRAAFCPCSQLHVPQIIDDPEPAVPVLHTDSLADFSIETASFAELARWSYKAREALRQAK